MKRRSSRPMNVDGLVHALGRYGFVYKIPLGRTWYGALVNVDTVAQKALCVLLRKNGIDLRYYDSYTGQMKLCDDGGLSMTGGILCRNHFNQSDTLVTQKVRYAGYHFSKGRPIDIFLKPSGKSYRLNPNFEKIRKASRERFQDRFEELTVQAMERSLPPMGFDSDGAFWGPTAGILTRDD